MSLREKKEKEQTKVNSFKFILIHSSTTRTLIDE
jgi:hypothetical protein